MEWKRRLPGLKLLVLGLLFLLGDSPRFCHQAKLVGLDHRAKRFLRGEISAYSASELHRLMAGPESAIAPDPEKIRRRSGEDPDLSGGCSFPVESWAERQSDRQVTRLKGPSAAQANPNPGEMGNESQVEFPFYSRFPMPIFQFRSRFKARNMYPRAKGKIFEPPA
ncbi:uncharacterized protein THITE_110207 [Thermothielavioides terrestris NRRL 8126]|uniref:Uncharacterized protein n=1 Tax=Thermothielavioides terrestris (strain ATCC 38088 / NRRL 8126) TaxID=578455 RepID=G2R4W7_THETT|nr:uncharacterized protein THITE_110207 [Thermothielavioides terrestris NRRL 8126]AEO66952.1 hypothetical protein THITE_110207 [Thermothielavioides terrestris NRRL 8126]